MRLKDKYLKMLFSFVIILIAMSSCDYKSVNDKDKESFAVKGDENIKIKNLEWKTYSNLRYSFDVSLPDNDKLFNKLPDNADGITVYSYDSTFILKVYGRYNILNEDFTDLFKKTIESGKFIDTSSVSYYFGDNYYIIEGILNNQFISLEKTIVTNNIVLTCIIKYKEDATSINYEPLSKQIIDSFNKN